jgi:hypothetical protein
VFGSGVGWVGSSLNHSGSDVRILQISSSNRDDPKLEDPGAAAQSDKLLIALFYQVSLM